MYENIFLDGKTLVYYDQSDEENRVFTTAEDLLENFSDKTVNKWDSKLIPSNKELETWKSFWNLHKAFSDFYHWEVRDLIRKWEIESIVIVSNRSYAQSFETIWWWNLYKSTKDSIDQMQKDWYLDYDLSWELLWKWQENLKILPDNFNEIKEELGNIWINIQAEWILDYQNKINIYFKAEIKELYRLLSNPNVKNHDLHIFSLDNLISIKRVIIDREVISEFLSRTINDKSNKEILEIFKLLYSNKTNYWSYYLLMIKRIWLDFSVEELWITYDENNDFEFFNSVLLDSDERSNSIFESSLDSKVRDWRNIEKRKIFYYKKNEEKIENNKWEIKNTKEKIEYEKVVLKEDYFKGEDIWSYHMPYQSDIENQVIIGEKGIWKTSIFDIKRNIDVLLWNVGDGKSIFLSNLYREIQDDNNSIALFFTWKLINEYENKNLNQSVEKNIFNNKFYSYLTSLIKNINKYFWEKKLYIFIDGIDEIDQSTRDTLLDNIEMWSIISLNEKYILWSRKYIFDEKWSDIYKSIMFEELEDDEIQSFLKSRLWINESCDEKWGDKYKKLDVINEFLEKNILDNNLKHTYLILYLLTQLSIDDLEKIWNRWALYETIVRDIIKKHNISKWATHSSDYIDSDMNTLWEVAYAKNEIVLSDEIIQKFWILFKKIWDNKYSFIHQSFQEFFTARYLSKQKKWNKKILKIRDKNQENWNKWRNLKPVVQFYWELLINSWEFKKLKELLEWLLENDDIFWEWFFMGLGILIKSKNILKNHKENKRIKKFWDLYESEIMKWENGQLISKLGWFKKLQKDNNYNEPYFINIFSERFLDSFWENMDNIIILAQHWSNSAKNWLLETANNLHNMWEYGDSRNMYLYFIRNGIKEAQQYLLNISEKLYAEGKYKKARFFYTHLLNHWNKEAEKWLLSIAEMLYSEGKYSESWNSYMDLLENWNTQVENRLLEVVEKLGGRKDYNKLRYIYLHLLEYWSNEYLKIENMLVYETQYWKYSRVYIRLLEKWNKELENWLLMLAKRLEFEEKYQEAKKIYKDLLNYWSKNAKKFILMLPEYLEFEKKYQESENWLLEKWKRLYHENQYDYAEKIFEELFENWNESALLRLLKIAEKLYIKWHIIHAYNIIRPILKVKTISKDSKYILLTEKIAKQFFDQEKYYESWILYKLLLKNRNKEIEKLALDCWNKLLKQGKYKEASDIFLSLLEYWTIEVKELLLECAEGIFEIQEYFHLGDIYTSLLDLWYDNAIKSILKFSRSKLTINSPKFINDLLNLYKILYRSNKRIS